MKKLSGKVKFLFQQTEEQVAGASAMIERGVLENPRVDRVIAAHVTSQFEMGNIGVKIFYEAVKQYLPENR